MLFRMAVAKSKHLNEYINKTRQKLRALTGTKSTQLGEMRFKIGHIWIQI